MDMENVSQTRVVTVERETSIAEAAQIMREAHVGDVVVVEAQGKHPVPVGILTDRDIIMATVAIGAAPGAFAVGDIMSDGLVTASADTSVDHLINLMKTHGIRRIPLIGKDQALVGIVSVEDIMRVLSDELSALAEVATRQRDLEVQKRRKVA